MSFVAVVDYGMGNLHSIAKALQYVEPTCKIEVVNDPIRIMQAERVVFPGVGAMRDCMQALRSAGLDQVVQEVAASKPFLGICLGMQALMTHSAENSGIQALNIIPGQVLKFPDHFLNGDGETLKIPHMGWNRVQQIAHPLWSGIPQDSRFYFVHSYFVRPDNADDTIATTEYAGIFSAAVAHKNIFAVQFHPEKSQAVGLRLLQNFLNWDGLV